MEINKTIVDEFEEREKKSITILFGACLGVCMALRKGQEIQSKEGGRSRKISQDLYTVGQWKGSCPTYVYQLNKLKIGFFNFIDRRRYFLFSFIKELPQNAKVLDWGCGTGYLVLPLKKELNMDAYGCDAAQYPLDVLKEYAKEKKIEINLKQCDEYTLPYPDEFFDGIISADVFGHVSNPEKSVKELYRILKKGGIIAIQSESIHYRDRYFYKRIMNILKKDPWAEDVGHINLMSHEEIKESFEKQGFVVEKSFSAAQYLGFFLNGDIMWGLKQLKKEQMDISLTLLVRWHVFLATPTNSWFYRYLRLLINILLVIEERIEVALHCAPGGSLYLKLRKVK